MATAGSTSAAFFDRWMKVLPLPLTEHDQVDGYWWELSMRQIETSRTMVFDPPRHVRSFFEALVADNLDIGRPGQVELIFTGPPHVGRRHKIDCTPKTRIVTRDTEVTVNAFYEHSRVKQYLKDRRAWRIETVVNSPTDLGCHRRLEHLDDCRPTTTPSAPTCATCYATWPSGPRRDNKLSILIRKSRASHVPSPLPAFICM